MRRARGQEWIFSDRAARSTEQETPDWEFIRHRAAAVSRASRYPFRWAHCLQRSLALREWLAADGVPSEVRYGMRRDGEAYLAHAWLICAGHVVNDSERNIRHFAPLMDRRGALALGNAAWSRTTSDVPETGGSGDFDRSTAAGATTQVADQ